MNQLTKTRHSFGWMMSLIAVTVLFFACNSNDTSTEKPATDSMTPATTAPADTLPAAIDTSKPKTDTLPPLDTTSSTRPPEVRKTK